MGTPAPVIKTLLVLVADPDADNRSLYCESLRGAGFEVEEAVDGREALVKGIAYHPTLIITETRLPFIDGYALSALLRNDPATHDSHIIACTEDAKPGHIARAYASGADAVLVKPCLPETLLTEMERLGLAGRESDLRQKLHTKLKLTGQLEKPADPPRPREQRSAPRVKARRRFETIRPPVPPPQLRCRLCDLPLKYLRSHVGGVSDLYPEQWDYYSCTSCGTFQYRHRTRTLRRART